MDMQQIEIAPGIRMPQLGFGVWRIGDEDAAGAVRSALDAGYRAIDTAAIYRNEAGVGAGLRAAELPRDRVFVATKLWNDRHDDAEAALGESLDRLGLDQVDLFLIHWPGPDDARYLRAWRQLIALRGAGKARSIGVSNFQPRHLRHIMDETGVAPALNQIELHPWLQQTELRDFHRRHGIATQAWSPIGQGGELLGEPVLARIAERHGRSPAQVVLRWHLQLGNSAIPKSSNPARIRENIALDFVLAETEMAEIAALDRGRRLGPDPDLFG